MYNLYDKYLRGNSIGCCPLYVSYYLLYTLKKLMYLRGNSIGTDNDGRRRRRRRHTLNLFRVLTKLKCSCPTPSEWVACVRSGVSIVNTP